MPVTTTTPTRTGESLAAKLVRLVSFQLQHCSRRAFCCRWSMLQPASLLTYLLASQAGAQLREPASATLAYYSHSHSSAFGTTSAAFTPSKSIRIRRCQRSWLLDVGSLSLSLSSSASRLAQQHRQRQAARASEQTDVTSIMNGSLVWPESDCCRNQNRTVKERERTWLRVFLVAGELHARDCLFWEFNNLPAFRLLQLQPG